MIAIILALLGGAIGFLIGGPVDAAWGVIVGLGLFGFWYVIEEYGGGFF